MAKFRLTLQNRITTLMVLSSVLFIAAFTFIQVNNQMENINRHNSYRLNLATIVAKNYFEAAIREAKPEEISNYLKSNLKELKDSDIIKQAVIFNREGKIIASTQEGMHDESVSYRDLSRITALEELLKSNKWFIPEVNKESNLMNIYLTLRSDPQGPLTYVTKLSFSLSDIQEALSEVYFPVILTTIIVILANIILGYFISKTIIGPIKVLNDVTKIITAGDLSVRAHINTNDELEELGSTFNYMTEELIKMKERAENENPLTKLPGNIVIREEIEKRIKNNLAFLVIYCDLDNFKEFNDKYGIGKGDEAIKLIADVFKEALETKGNQDDFLGHEGGDDFILITTPLKAQAVADYIISEFDKKIRSLYSTEDLKQGFIIAHARDHTVKQFPIMTISLAGISNETRTITSYAEVTNIAAEVKKKAKSIDGSVFIIDKRKD